MWEFKGASGACFALAMAIACVGCSQREEPKIGYMGALSGRYVDLGSSGRNGAMLAFEEAKASKRIGESAQFLAFDDEQSVERASLGLRELSSKGARVVVGPMTSNLGVVAAPVAAELGVVLIASTVAADELSGKDDNFFRLINSAGVMGGSTGQANAWALGGKKIVAVYDASNTSYTLPWVEAFENSSKEAGNEVVAKIGYDGKSKPNFEALAKQAMASGADSMALACNSLDAASLATKARAIEPKVMLIGSGWTGTERLLELAGSAVEGMLIEQYVEMDDPQYKDFLTRYNKRFSLTGGYPSFKAYMAMKAAIQTGAAMAPSAAEAKRLLLEGQAQGMVFDRFGDFAGSAHYSLVKNGSYSSRVSK